MKEKNIRLRLLIKIIKLPKITIDIFKIYSLL